MPASRLLRLLDLLAGHALEVLPLARGHMLLHLGDSSRLILEVLARSGSLVPLPRGLACEEASELLDPLALDWPICLHFVCILLFSLFSFMKRF